MPNIAALVTVAAVMFAVLGAITLIAHIYNLNNIKSKTVGDGQHGTARWAKAGKAKPTANHDGDSTEKTAPKKDRADRGSSAAGHRGRLQGRQA